MEPSIQAEVGSIRGVNDAPAGGHAREWWERYLPLLIPLLFVSIYIVYVWPSYPDLMPVFVVWMVLVTAALWFVALRVIKLLKSPEYKSKAFNSNVRPLRFNKLQLASPLISMGANMALLATLQVSVSWLFKHSAVTDNLRVFFLLASFVFTTLFVLLWAGTSPDAEWRLGGYPSLVAIMAVIVVVVTGAAFAGLRLTEQLVSGPPASWSDLLRFAQHEAEKIDNGAVLESVRADPPYNMDPPYSPQSTAFVTDFVFRRPNGASIKLEVLDTDRPRLRSVDDEWDELVYENSPALPPHVLPGYAANLSYIKLSPRGAYRITEQEGLAFAQEIAPGQAPEVHVTLFLAHDWQDWFGVPAGWNMEYTVRVNGDYTSLNLRVDGASGEILDREQR